MFGYQVDISTYCDTQRASEPYGKWSEDCVNTFRGVKVCPKNGYPSITTTLEIQPDTPCHVVWLEYSSGDSFGRGRCNHTEILGVFTDLAAAKELANALRNHNVDDDNGFGPSKWTLELKTNDGQEHKIHCGWLGYFEKLEEVHINTTNMGI